MRDYTELVDLKTVLDEIADQVATRLRKNNVVAEVVSIYIGMANIDKQGRTHFSAQMHIEPTDSTQSITTPSIICWKQNGMAVQSVMLASGAIEFPKNGQLTSAYLKIPKPPLIEKSWNTPLILFEKNMVTKL